MVKRKMNGVSHKAAATAGDEDIIMQADPITSKLPAVEIADGTDDPMADPQRPGDDDDDEEIFEPDFLSEDEDDRGAAADEEASNIAGDEEELAFDGEEEEDNEDDDEDEEMDGGAPLTTRESLSPSAIPLIGVGGRPPIAESSIADSTTANPIHVSKPIPYTYDAGHLLISDTNPLPPTTSATLEAILTANARDAAQSLLNHLLTTCPIHTLNSTATSGSGIEMTLPPPVYLLPREKKVPEPKAPTKWEQFAAKKGIQKKGRDSVQGRQGKMVYDEASGEWVPKWGYKGKNKDGEGDWLVEIDEKKEKKAMEEKSGKGGKDVVMGVNPRNVSRQERMERIKRNERMQRANERKGRKKVAG